MPSHKWRVAPWVVVYAAQTVGAGGSFCIQIGFRSTKSNANIRIWFGESKINLHISTSNMSYIYCRKKRVQKLQQNGCSSKHVLAFSVVLVTSRWNCLHFWTIFWLRQNRNLHVWIRFRNSCRVSFSRRRRSTKDGQYWVWYTDVLLTWCLMMNHDHFACVILAFSQATDTSLFGTRVVRTDSFAA